MQLCCAECSALARPLEGLRECGRPGLSRAGLAPRKGSVAWNFCALGMRAVPRWPDGHGSTPASGAAAVPASSRSYQMLRTAATPPLCRLVHQ